MRLGLEFSSNQVIKILLFLHVRTFFEGLFNLRNSGWSIFSHAHVVVFHLGLHFAIGGHLSNTIKQFALSAFTTTLGKLIRASLS